MEGEIYWAVDTITFRFYWTIIRPMRGDINDFCHPQIYCFVVSQLIRVARHARCLEQTDILQHSHEQTHCKRRDLNVYVSLCFVYIYMLNGYWLYIYICIYIYVYIYFKINLPTKRFVFFKELFISLLHTCMFSACCLPPRTYVGQGYMNGPPNATRTHSCRFVIRMFSQVLYRFS